MQLISPYYTEIRGYILRRQDYLAEKSRKKADSRPQNEKMTVFSPPQAPLLQQGVKVLLG